MKFTTTFAMLGFAAAAERREPLDPLTRPDHPVWGLRSVIDHAADAQTQIAFGDHATTNANGRPPLRSHVQIAESSSSSSSNSDKSSDSSSSDDGLAQMQDDDEVDHSGEFFKAAEHDKLGDGGYKRVTTSRFSDDADDIFMRSMIEQYSLEGKNKDGSPNGQFWMDEANARAASSEVLDTHKGLKGAARETYLKTYFPRTFAHFDVNRTGKIESIKMPQFMRFLCSDQQMYLW
jgi:hypothetical protein